MKTILAILLCCVLMQMSYSQERIEYKGKPITAVQLKKLYDFSKTFLFSRDGQIYDIRDKNGEIKTLPINLKVGSIGFITGQITKRTSKSTAFAELVFTRKMYPNKPLNIDGNTLLKITRICTLLDITPETGKKISLPLIRIDSASGNEKEDMTFAVLKPMTQAEFTEYIKTNYIYKYEATYAPCKECQGKGYIAKEQEKGKMQSLRDKCPYCNGTKNVKVSATKVPVEI